MYRFVFRAGVCLYTGLAILACGDGLEEFGPAEPELQGSSWENFRAGVYEEPDTGIFIVNGDEPIYSEKNLREFHERLGNSNGLIVNRTGFNDDRWSNSQKVSLTYCVSTSFGGRYNQMVAEMSAAAGAWEAAGNVNFIHASAFDSSCNASTGVVFDVRPVNSGAYLARAFFPSSSRSQSNVLVDGSAFNNPGVSLTGVLRHELGHVLGFRHEHTRPEAGQCFENNSWRELTSYDSASVMHYPQCNGTGSFTDLSLTPQDRDGTSLLYGAPGGGAPPPPPDGTPKSETFTGIVNQRDFPVVGTFDVVGGTSFSAVMTGSGDPDLYVRFDAPPTTSRYNCRPYRSGANETCTLDVPQNVGQVVVAVRGYRSGTYSIDIDWVGSSP